MQDQVFKEHEQSEFNSALATLERIHEIKKWLGASVLKEDPYFYYKHIKMYFKELYPMFTDELELQKRNWDKAKSFFPIKDVNDTQKINEIINFLENWELELRLIEQVKGMNMPKKADARWALARR